MVPELRRFAGRDVAGISREEIAECVAQVFRRNESAGDHLRRVLGSMWTFLGDDCRRRQTSVPANLLLRLKSPEPARRLRATQCAVHRRQGRSAA